MSSTLGNRSKSLLNLNRNTSHQESTRQESIKRSQSCGNIKDKVKSSIKKKQLIK